MVDPIKNEKLKRFKANGHIINILNRTLQFYKAHQHQYNVRYQ